MGRNKESTNIKDLFIAARGESGLSKEWTLALEEIEYRLFESIQINDPCKFAIAINQMCTLHWGMKLFFNKYLSLPIPYCREGYFKPHGELLVAVINLASACFSRGDINGYDSISTWVLCILLEYEIWNDTPETHNKSTAIEKIKANNTNFRKYINPYDKTLTPHTWALIQYASLWAGSYGGTSFKSDQWDKFLKARSALVYEIKKPRYQSVVDINGVACLKENMIGSKKYAPLDGIKLI